MPLPKTNKLATPIPISIHMQSSQQGHHLDVCRHSKQCEVMIPENHAKKSNGFP